MANDRVTVFNPTAYSSNHISEDFENYDWKGVHLIADVTVATSGTVTFYLEGKADADTYYPIGDSGAITASGATVVRVYPGLASPNINDVLPPIWRVRAVNAGEFEYGVYAELVD